MTTAVFESSRACLASPRTHRLVRPGNLVRRPIGLCQQAGTDLDPGLHHYTRNPANVTCPECVEWMHA